MSKLTNVWVFSDNPERYAELFGGAQQWGQQVYAIVRQDSWRLPPNAGRWSAG